jgi:hypothetical protein
MALAMKKLRIYPRKKVKFAGIGWKYRYCGKSFSSIEDAKQSYHFRAFVISMGDGCYEFFTSEGKIEDRLKVKNLGYRSMVNRKNKLIRPSRNLIHNRQAECSSCYQHGYSDAFDEAYNLGYQQAIHDFGISVSVPKVVMPVVRVKMPLPKIHFPIPENYKINRRL